MGQGGYCMDKIWKASCRPDPLGSGKNLTPKYNGQFCESFNFSFDEKARMSINSQMGPKPNQVDFKHLGLCLFIKSWSSSPYRYAVKSCNCKPNSTFPPCY